MKQNLHFSCWCFLVLELVKNLSYNLKQTASDVGFSKLCHEILEMQHEYFYRDHPAT